MTAAAYSSGAPAIMTGWQKPKGFSLLELLTVLVMLGIISAIAAPATGRFLATLNFQKQTQKVLATLRYARLMAVAQGKEVRLALGEEQSAFVLTGGVVETRPFDLGEDDTLVLEPAEIVFLPEGHATPGVITYSRSGRVQKIVMDPLTALPLLD